MSNSGLFERSWVDASLIWVAALSIFVVGIYLTSIQFLQTEWLSRAGCIIVLIGLWSTLGGIVQQRLLSDKLRKRCRNAKIRARAEFEENSIDENKIENELHKIEETFSQQATELEQRLKFSLGVLEFSLLITGTIFWGFGDLFVQIIS